MVPDSPRQRLGNKCARCRNNLLPLRRKLYNSPHSELQRRTFPRNGKLSSVEVLQEITRRIKIREFQVFNENIEKYQTDIIFSVTEQRNEMAGVASVRKGPGLHWSIRSNYRRVP